MYSHRLRLVALFLLCLATFSVEKSRAAPPLRIPPALSLDEALRLFRVHGLELLLADAVVAQARAGVLQAGAPPNPLV